MSDASKTPAPQEEKENVSVKQAEQPNSQSSEPLGSQSNQPLLEQPAEPRSEESMEERSLVTSQALPEESIEERSPQSAEPPAEPPAEARSEESGRSLPEQPAETAGAPSDSSSEVSLKSPESASVAESSESELNESQANESELNESQANESQANESQANESGSALETVELAELTKQAAQLRGECQSLKDEIAQLQGLRGRLVGEQLSELQGTLGSLMQESLSELEKRKQALQISVEQLERRQERIRKEMRTTFAGVSQDLAIRVQGFKEYLTGSLQDLVSSVEELDLLPKEPPPQKPPSRESRGESRGGDRSSTPSPQFTEQGFQKNSKQIRQLLDRYRNQPEYYGPPWQLRRTFEPIHAERVSNWFFSQGGRGALRTMGSRLQNVLIASAIISILYKLYGKRLRPLILCSSSPERLGEWRRGLQDCLGVSRADFGQERGVVLFEDPEPLAARADRLLQDGMMPLIVIDESEEAIALSILQFPLWLAFAPDPKFRSDY
ncbi:MAG: DUF3086 domain-containing protein [Oscillatoria sp. SIO1A7]|nr:DUF3086 domain-containing protein [Oscillatoria sp. SIO1A7]